MKYVREHLNEYEEISDPVKDLGIGLTLEDELEKRDLISVSDIKEFDMDDENTASWSGNLIHPMSGYAGNFEYLSLEVNLEKNEDGKYVVTQEGERRSGKLSKRDIQDLDEGDLEIDEDNIEDWDYDVEYEINETETFDSLDDAMDYIDSEQCLDFQG